MSSLAANDTEGMSQTNSATLSSPASVAREGDPLTR